MYQGDSLKTGDDGYASCIIIPGENSYKRWEREDALNWHQKARQNEA